MLRRALYATLSLGLSIVTVAPLSKANELANIHVKGMYVEARTCDVWTGPCFANADFNLGGKQGMLAWRIDQGPLQGLSVVAVVTAANTLGLEQHSPGKAVIIVDSKANLAQREALVRFAKEQGGRLLDNVVKVHAAPITINGCPCKSNACTEVDAGVAKLKTRCLDGEHDKVCGNEYAFYPPLAKNVAANPAGVVEHAFRGEGLGGTWSDSDRRGGYVGSFQVK
jgi:Protein of unknown function (DUF1326)